MSNERLRNGVKDNNLAEVKIAIEVDKINPNTDLTEGKLGIFSQFTPTAAKAIWSGSRDSLGYRALHWAARLGHVEIIEYLLSQGANPDQVNYIGNTPLHVALYYQQPQAVFKLQSVMQNINIRNTGSMWFGVNEQFSPLHYAVLYGTADQVKLLLEAGADVALLGTYSLTALHLAVRSRDTEKVRVLLEHMASQAQVEALKPREDGDEVDLEEFETCLIKDIDRSIMGVDSKDSEGRTPLHFAAYDEAVPADIMNILLQYKASLFLKDNSDCTPGEYIINFCWKNPQSQLQKMQMMLCKIPETKRQQFIIDMLGRFQQSPQGVLFSAYLLESFVQNLNAAEKQLQAVTTVLDRVQQQIAAPATVSVDLNADTNDSSPLQTAAESLMVVNRAVPSDSAISILSVPPDLPPAPPPLPSFTAPVVNSGSVGMAPPPPPPPLPPVFSGPQAAVILTKRESNLRSVPAASQTGDLVSELRSALKKRASGEVNKIINPEPAENKNVAKKPAKSGFDFFETLTNHPAFKNRRAAIEPEEPVSKEDAWLEP